MDSFKILLFVLAVLFGAVAGDETDINCTGILAHVKKATVISPPSSSSVPEGDGDLALIISLSVVGGLIVLAAIVIAVVCIIGKMKHKDTNKTSGSSKQSVEME